MKNLAIVLTVCLIGLGASAQNRTYQIGDLALTGGDAQGSTALSYSFNWLLGKKQKLSIGVGARLTNYFGTKKDFISAGPAKYTRSFTTPFLIFFAGQEEQNFDTLNVQRPQVNSLNSFVSIGYQISKKWSAGFNIDLVGVSFGRNTSGVFTSNGITRIDPDTKPVAFNVLLTGDHDRGTLNSEFFVGYKLSDKWLIRGIYQFLFVEYKTNTVVQTYSDGKTNERFRNKANNWGIGISYKFH